MTFHLQALIVAALCSLPAIEASAGDITAMMIKLRVPIGAAPYDWPSRLPRVIAIAQNQKPDVLGVQEVTPTMIKDLHSRLPG